MDAHEPRPLTDTPTARVRGYKAFNEPAMASVKTMALIIDASIFVALYCALHHALRLSLSSGFVFLGVYVFLFAGLAFLIQTTWGATPGQLAWRLVMLYASSSPDGPVKHRLGWTHGLEHAWRLYWASSAHQREHLNRGIGWSATFLTVLSVGVAAAVFSMTLAQHPLLKRAELTRLEPFAPLDAKNQAMNQEWVAVPFFYSLGAWPERFAGRPVLYGLPYMKGPPHRFVGHIVARWEAPDTQVTIEGPKTPTQDVKPDLLRHCLSHTWSFRCLKIREQTLSRHLQEMATVDPQKWTIQWFEVENSSIAPEERARGFYISAEGPQRAQDRYVMVTAKGTHQAFILDRPLNYQGVQAKKLFDQAIRSQRVSDELGSGKAWIDQMIAKKKLGTLQAEKDPQAIVENLSEIQALLLSKISVDPKTFDSYFHLAGTAFMLAQHAFKEKNTDWSAAAKPMVESVIRYARDIAPEDARMPQLENMWIDIKKY